MTCCNFHNIIDADSASCSLACDFPRIRLVGPFYSSRFLDQEFGTAIRRDDLLFSSWKPRPSVLQSGYVRQWRSNDLTREKFGSTLNVEDGKSKSFLSDRNEYFSKDPREPASVNRIRKIVKRTDIGR